MRAILSSLAITAVTGGVLALGGPAAQADLSTPTDDCPTTVSRDEYPSPYPPTTAVRGMSERISACPLRMMTMSSRRRPY